MSHPKTLIESPSDNSTTGTTYCSSLLTASAISTKSQSWSNIANNFLVTVDPNVSGAGYFTVDLSFALFYNDDSEHNVYAQVLVINNSQGRVAGAIQERHAESSERSAFLRGVFELSSTTDSYVFIPQWKVDGGTGYIAGVPESQPNLITNFLVVSKIGDESMVVGGSGANS